MKTLITWLRAIWNFFFGSELPVALVATPEATHVPIVGVAAVIQQEAIPRNPRHTKRISCATYSTKTRKGLQ